MPLYCPKWHSRLAFGQTGRNRYDSLSLNSVWQRSIPVQSEELRTESAKAARHVGLRDCVRQVRIACNAGRRISSWRFAQGASGLRTLTPRWRTLSVSRTDQAGANLLFRSTCGSGFYLCDEGKQIIEQPICPFILGEIRLCACPAHQALGTFVIVGR